MFNVKSHFKNELSNEILDPKKMLSKNYPLSSILGRGEKRILNLNDGTD